MISTARMKAHDEPTMSDVADANLRKKLFISSLSPTLKYRAATKKRRAALDERTPAFVWSRTSQSRSEYLVPGTLEPVAGLLRVLHGRVLHVGGLVGDRLAHGLRRVNRLVRDILRRVNGLLAGLLRLLRRLLRVLHGRVRGLRRRVGHRRARVLRPVNDLVLSRRLRGSRRRQRG